ncbi:MAG: head decoration protein [Pseudomonadota bacterium]
MSIVLTSPRRPGEAILTEADGYLSRDTLTIGPNQDFPANTLLGRVVGAGDVTVAKTDVLGAGKGALTLAHPAFGSTVKPGTYHVVFVEPATDAGAFVVEDPDGTVIGRGTAGVAFDGPVKFTIADGGTDFVPGDTASVTVTLARPHRAWAHKAWDPDATDGSQVPVAMSIYAVKTAEDETKDVAAITGSAELMSPNIAWPDGVTGPEKLTAEAALHRAGIKLR